MAITKEELGFDPEVLRKKYDQERDKRLRPDGNSQYVRPKGEFSHYLDDPYVERVERAPIAKDVEVAVLGGGFGALLAAARLREAGIDDVCLIEKAGDFGGTWYWNRYPGAACDVESYIYLPLLEETGYMPTEKYARAPEIFDHAKAIGRKFGLYERTLFQTGIKKIEWNEAASRWNVSTDRGDTIGARYFIMASGHYHNPKLPGIPGIERFKGSSFHTSRWDFNYTGGNCLGNLTKLVDKNVGIIGTGATAIQCVPHLGAWSKQLYVFQRTPSGVDFRGDRPTDPEWVKTLTPGWQKRRIDNFTKVVMGMPAEQDLVDDSWTKPMWAMMQRATRDTTPEQFAELMQLADYKTMEGVRHRIDEIVKDKATAEALKPWYNRLCKRPCFHDDYLPTFNRQNVKLVDTAGLGVDEITEDSLVVAGHEYKVDCLVYATGFDLGAFTGRPVMPVVGRNGVELSQKWKDGATTMHGIHVHGFPNFFILSTTQSAWGPNFPHMMEEQARHIAHIIREAGSQGAKKVEVSADAERDWVAVHEQYAPYMARIWAECTPSYFNNEGKASPVILRNGGFGGGVFMFVDLLEKWRTEGKLAGLQLSGTAG